MRIFLINPPPPEKVLYHSVEEKLPPLGLAFIASILEKAGHDVRIFDNYLFRVRMNKLVTDIEKFEPDIIGITCTSVVYSEAKKIARTMKEVFGVPIIMGGPHVSVRPNQTLLDTKADVAVRGEGEYSMLELVEFLEKGGDLRRVRGISYKKNGEIIYNPSRPLINNLDELPPPAWHLLPMEKYPRKCGYVDVYPVDSHNTSRGCPFHCRFCSVSNVWGRSYRFFSPKRMILDIKFLVDNYGTSGIYFREDNFTVNRKRVLEFCNLIRKEKIDLHWLCESRVDLVNHELLTAMKNAGCEYIWFGVESGSNRVLELLNKGITIEDSLRAFELCKKVGIQTGASLMIGTPGETMEDIKKTLELRAKFFTMFNSDVWLNLFTGIPTSILYEKVIQKGWYKNMDEAGICEIATPDFDRQKLLEITVYLSKKIALNPKYILKRLIKIRNLKQIIKLSNSLFTYLRM